MPCIIPELACKHAQRQKNIDCDYSRQHEVCAAGCFNWPPRCNASAYEAWASSGTLCAGKRKQARTRPLLHTARAATLATWNAYGHGLARAQGEGRGRSRKQVDAQAAHASPCHAQAHTPTHLFSAEKYLLHCEICTRYAASKDPDRRQWRHARRLDASSSSQVMSRRLSEHPFSSGTTSLHVCVVTLDSVPFATITGSLRLVAIEE